MTIVSMAVAIAGALALEGAVSVTAGAVACAVLIVVLLNLQIASADMPSDADGVFLILALVPLGGLLAVVMPTDVLVSASWPLLAAAPLGLAVVLTARQLALGVAELGLAWPDEIQQALIALTGLPLGLLAYVLVQPPELAGKGTVTLSVLSLLVLAAVEELVFRGLLQPALCRRFGAAAGIGITAALSAAAAFGTRSIGYAVLAGVVAAGFGLAARSGRSVIGTSLARWVMYATLLVLWPAVLG